MGRLLNPLLACSLLALVLPAMASAQEVGSTAPSVYASDPEFTNRAVGLGAFRLTAGAEARIDYDSNVFAEPVDGSSDAVFRAAPYAEISREGPLSLSLRGSLDLRRYASESSENSEGGRVQLRAGLALPAGQLLSSEVSWDRAIEDRGDPEARTLLGLGPRRYDILTGGLAYRRTSARFLLNLAASAQKVDALDILDADRDYNAYSGQAAFGIRPGGAFYIVASAFTNRREFRLEEIVPGVDRDTTTYGGRLGIQSDGKGLIEGRLAAGLFKLEPDDAATQSRTGFSVDGLLTYRPQRRTAISLEMFQGDVASFRGGASARKDSSISLRLEQEIRHNLLGRLSAGYRRTSFFSLAQQQETWRLGAEAEYLLGPNASLIASVRYGDRDSDIPIEVFDRFMAGVGVRIRL
ncbi:outer membrane beta-barrel protein [Allopontixanthobacter sediminis]|uniref:Outer membrane beta-barrel protein n=1 Tax=Allopontixanthobacter sediminis TaxID=1689985 RepID=A0A845AXU3_9SPHN|nr:outer membrane beta-barrel protein [Allopontixanthobacter sediminis]MXP44333.1 outer membrane beta-barrel protein [Allopontixanthobacter sediminis]